MHDIFYFTDVHGMYDLYKAAMDYCINEDPECAIIYGGDACDRGNSGYKIMNELLNNPRVCYLKGNHEDMFVHAAIAIKQLYKSPLEEDYIFDFLYNQEINEDGDKAIHLHLYNGGYYTLYNWMMDGMPEEFIDKINKLPLTFSYENLDFCHAGGTYEAFENASRAEYFGDWVDKEDAMMLLWDRMHLSTGWAPERTCIFGHTPTVHLPSIYYGKDKSISNIHPCSYIGLFDNKFNGKKIDMDTGTFNSKKLYVLNCLTLKAQGFELKDNEIKKIKRIRV